MESITCKNGYTIIRRHFFIILFRIMKFIIVLSLATFLYWFYLSYVSNLEILDFIKYTYIFVVLGLINYVFLSLILGLIKYFYNLIVIYDDQIVIIKCSLLYKDDIEMIDAYRVMKFDSFQRGFISNIFSFGDIILEQQKNDVRVFHYIPNPHRVISILQIQRDGVLNKRGVNDID